MPMCFFFFFFNDTATTEIYTLSLHDALPISIQLSAACKTGFCPHTLDVRTRYHAYPDRKSTRLNSSHQIISYAVFCLKKKNSRRVRPSATGSRTCLLDSWPGGVWHIGLQSGT